jgi:hypothetical protein
MATRKRKVGSYATGLVKKAREAMLTAVQIYNNPQISANQKVSQNRSLNQMFE